MMLEELRDYLVRQGFVENFADAIHDAYYAENMEGVCEYVRGSNDERYNYVLEVCKHVMSWRREVGEADEGTIFVKE